jgi:hypothetical protein
MADGATQGARPYIQFPFTQIKIKAFLMGSLYVRYFHLHYFIQGNPPSVL